MIMIAKQALLLCLCSGLTAGFVMDLGTTRTDPATTVFTRTTTQPPPGRYLPTTTTTTTTTTTASTSTSTSLHLQMTEVAPELKPPPALYQGAVAVGANKAGASFEQILKLGIVAGCHIGFGAYLAITVGGACPGLAQSNPGLQKMVMGAFGLPFGLMMTLVSGAELFTGNTALVTAAKQEGKIGWGPLIKNWTASYLGNLIGSLILAFLVYKSGTLGDAPGAVNIATAKCALTWQTAFVRGILCNWLVCMAVYMASGCSSMVGKMTAIWFPISAFVAMGLDHSVANMFIIPLGMLRGAQITIGQFLLKNLLPVTLGNIVGGVSCTMLPFGTTFGNWFKSDDKKII